MHKLDRYQRKMYPPDDNVFQTVTCLRDIIFSIIIRGFASFFPRNRNSRKIRKRMPISRGCTNLLFGRYQQTVPALDEIYKL